MFMVKIQTIVMVAVELASMEMVKQLLKKFVNMDVISIRKIL